MSCSEWKEYKLGDIIDDIIDNRGKTPPTVEEGIELIETACLIGNNKNIDFNKVSKYVSLETYKTWFRSGHPKVDDILISLVGANMGNLCIVKEERGAIAQNLVGIRLNKNICNPQFIYYVLSSYNTQQALKNMNRGSAQPNLKISDLVNLNIKLPSLEEQEKIAKILSSLDDKIELNNEMNKTLEEMAQSIFKRWFVDFEFPNEDGEPYKSSDGEMVESELGMIPKGWKVVTSEDICNFNKYSYSKKDNWNYINYLDTSNITKNKIDNIQKIDCINEKIPSRAKRKVSENSIVYSTVRPNQLHYGIIKKPVENMIVSTGFATIDSKYDYIKNDFIYYWLTQSQNTDKLQAIGETSTTTFPAIKATDIKKMKLVISDENMLREISNKLDKINLYLNDLREEEILLKELRDSLLSKIMNGHI